MDCLTALLLILDNVDYTRGNCRATEMVGAVLPKEVIKLAREAAEKEMIKSGYKPLFNLSEDKEGNDA